MRHSQPWLGRRGGDNAGTQVRMVVAVVTVVMQKVMMKEERLWLWG